MRQYRHERHLDRLEQLIQALSLQFRFEFGFQFQGDVSIFGSIVAYPFRRHITHRQLALSLRTDECVDMDGLIVEIHFSHEVHVVMHLGLQDIMGNHRVEHRTLYPHAVIGQHDDVVFHVLPHFKCRGVFKHGLQLTDDMLCRCFVGRNRHIIGFALLHSETHPHQFGHHRFGAGRFGIETDSVGCHQGRYQLSNGLIGVDQMIVVRDIGQRIQ